MMPNSTSKSFFILPSLDLMYCVNSANSKYFPLPMQQVVFLNLANELSIELIQNTHSILPRRSVKRNEI